MGDIDKAIESVLEGEEMRQWLMEYGPTLWKIWKHRPGAMKEFLQKQVMELEDL